jgi:hypothetical protein
MKSWLKIHAGAFPVGLALLAMTVVTSPAWGQCGWTSGSGTITEACGSVGIGTTSPEYPVTILNSEAAQLLLIGTTPSSYTQMILGGTGHSWQVGVGNASETTFGVADNLFLRRRWLHADGT